MQFCKSKLRIESKRWNLVSENASKPCKQYIHIPLAPLEYKMLMLGIQTTYPTNFHRKVLPPDRMNLNDNLAKFDILVNLEIPLRNLAFFLFLHKKTIT